MIQRFLVAFALCFLVLTSKIALASDVDWDSVPRINSKAQLATYIEEGRRKGQTEFHFILTNFKFSLDREIAEKQRDNLLHEYCYSFAFAPSVGLSGIFGTGQINYMIMTEFPGTRVANAYLNGDTSNLTMEEANLYNIAVEIVVEANKRTSEVEKARYIHDEICRLAHYPENPSNKTAIGALMLGETNCIGYTDAFYMLGRMCGLNVRRIGGYINKDNGKHGWNIITFNDGRSYCVDVTNDDINNTNLFFCAGKDTMQQYFTCDWSIIPNLQ